MIKDRQYTIAIIKILLATMFWGGTFIAGRIIAPYASPALVGFMRFLVASIILIIALEIQNNSILKQKLILRDYVGVFILAFSGMFAYNMFFIYGLQIVPASRASLIVANNPIAIALGAALFLKEKLNIIQVFGIFVSVCGAIIVLTNGDLSLIFNGVSYGDLIIFACVLSWLVYSLVGKVVLKRLSPLVAVTCACIIATFLFFPFAFNDLIHELTSMPAFVFISILYLGVCGTAISFVYFYEVMNLLGATKTGTFISFVPVFATLFSILILGEEINIAFIIAGVLIMTGVYLVNKK